MLFLRHILLTTLAVAYLMASTGVVVNLHYCLGRVKAVTLAVQEKESCICPDPNEAKDCCRSEQQLLETQSNHLISASFVFEAVSVAVKTHDLQWLMEQAARPAASKGQEALRAPPEAIYKRNQVFRI